MLRFILIMALLFTAGTVMAQQDSAARAGVVVNTVLDGHGNHAVAPLQSAIPYTWLAPDQHSARYEIMLVVHTQQMTPCLYTGGSRGTRYRVDVDVMITDLTEQKLVAQNRLFGAAPACRSTTTSSYTDYGNPDAYEFQRWLFQTMETAELPEVARVLDTDGPVQVLRVGADGTRLVTAAGSTLVVWDVGTGMPIDTLQADGRITGMEITPDGQTVVAATNSGALHIWDIFTGTRLGGTQIDQPIQQMALMPDGRHAVVVTDGLYQVSVITGQVVQEYRTLSTAPQVVAVSPDGTCVAAIFNDSLLRVWDHDAEVERFTDMGLGGGWTDLSFGNDGQRLAAVEADGTLHIWNMATNAEIAAYPLAGPVTRISYSPDGRLVAVVDGDTPLLLDPNTGQEVTRLAGHVGAVTDAAFSDDSTFIATAGVDSTVRLWGIGQ